MFEFFKYNLKREKKVVRVEKRENEPSNNKLQKKKKVKVKVDSLRD